MSEACAACGKKISDATGFFIKKTGAWFCTKCHRKLTGSSSEDVVTSMGKLVRVLTLEAEIRQIAQMVHQAYHVDVDGPWQLCNRGACQRARSALGFLDSAVEICHLGTRWNQCCCNCQSHVEDRHHPSATGLPISRRKGWICMAPEFFNVGAKIAFSGWSEHSIGCEMYLPRVHGPVLGKTGAEVERARLALNRGSYA